MSDGVETGATTQPRVVQVPVDLVELESRLVAMERRVQAQEARDQRLTQLIEAVLRLTEALAPVLEAVRPALELRQAAAVSEGALKMAELSVLEPGLITSLDDARSPAPGKVSATDPPAPPAEPAELSMPVVTPERLAAAQTRMRETVPEAEPSVSEAQVAAAQAPAAEDQPAVERDAAAPELSASAPPAASSEAAASAGSSAPSPPAGASEAASPPAAAPGRRSWVRRALRGMAQREPQAAGQLMQALLPAHRLAQIEPIAALPGPPATVAKIVVRGRLGRRLGWEMAQLDSDLATVTALARLARVRATPRELHRAGVRLEPPLAFALVAETIKPRWTARHRFIVAHQGPAAATFLQVRDGMGGLVMSELPSSGVATTIRCPDEELLAVLAGEQPESLLVLGEREPLQLLQEWVTRATRA